MILQIQISPPAITRSYQSGKIEVMKQIESSGSQLDPMNMIMNYMSQQISLIDEVRKKLKTQYPDLLSPKL